MPRTDCPDCGEPLRVNGTSCACGWSSQPKSKTAFEDRNHNRCQWQSAGERCRYVATFSPSTMGGGPWYCKAHFRCDDPIDGARIVEESAAEVPLGFDYTSEGLFRRTRERYKASVPPGDGKPHPVRGNVVAEARKSIDLEALAERAAIQAE